MKARDYDESFLAELGRRINSIAYGMGFARLELDVIEAMSLWIKKQFGDISMQEVALAFELVTAKKLPMGKNEGRHYNRFDQQYVGDVLYAYKTFRNHQVKLYKEEEAEKKLAEGASVPATGEEMYNGIKRIALEERKIMRVADWSSAYEYAWKENLVTHLNEEERETYRKSVEIALRSEKRAGIVLSLDNSIQAECHRRILQAHFQKMIDELPEEQPKPESDES